MLAERDLAGSVRCSYLSTTFVKLPSLFHDEPHFTLDRVSGHLNYNPQVKIDDRERQGDRKYKWVEQHIGLEELFAARCILLDKGERQIE